MQEGRARNDDKKRRRKRRETKGDSRVREIKKDRADNDKAGMYCKPDRASERQTRIRTREQEMSVKVDG